MPAARQQTRTLTTTEAAVLALLAIEGEQSGYDLLKQASRSVGQVWAPAKSQLYALLPRLVRDGLARSRQVLQSHRPDKQLYQLTAQGEEALQGWLESVEPGDERGFFVKLFVGGLTSHKVLRQHVEQYREDTAARLAELEAIEPTNTRTGHDWYHRFLLDLGLARMRQSIAWADDVLSAL